MKLIAAEAESEAIRRFVRRNRSHVLVTSVLARVEVLRAAQQMAPRAIIASRRQLIRFDEVDLSTAVIDRASTIAVPGLLPSLVAIHLATAERSGSDLKAIVTYDRRLAGAASDLGIPVTARPDSGRIMVRAAEIKPW